MDVAGVLESKKSERCVVLFSGGRDSTIAVTRLVLDYPHLTLLTVSTDHLIQIENVKQRLTELKRILPATVDWVHAVSRTNSLVNIGSPQFETCLPCHAVYFKTAVFVAKRIGAKRIAVGYTSYQDSWLEQTPRSIETLRSTLQEVNMDLLLPVSDLDSKEHAKQLLRSHSLDDGALEQKCMKQQFNTELLSEADLSDELESWKTSLRTSFVSDVLASVEIGPSTPLARW